MTTSFIDLEEVEEYDVTLKQILTFLDGIEVQPDDIPIKVRVVLDEY